MRSCVSGFINQKSHAPDSPGIMAFAASYITGDYRTPFGINPQSPIQKEKGG
jgi:hypothetical protein